LTGFLFVIVALQVARKIASCNMALAALDWNLIKFKKITKLFAALCFVQFFDLRRRSRAVLFSVRPLTRKKCYLSGKN